MQRFFEIFFIPTWMVQNVSIKKGKCLQICETIFHYLCQFPQSLASMIADVSRFSHTFPISFGMFSCRFPLNMLGTCRIPRSPHHEMPYPIDVAEKYLENPPFSSMIYQLIRNFHFLFTDFPSFPVGVPIFSHGFSMFFSRTEGTSSSPCEPWRPAIATLVFFWPAMKVWPTPYVSGQLSEACFQLRYDGNMMGM